MDTKWFYFSQNNSGGSFTHDPESGIGESLFIEANDAAHANARAERIGLYFNGCATGEDCPCCGDRWSKAYGGHDAPTRYGCKWRPVEPGEDPDTEWGIPLYIHFIGGEFKAAKQEAA